MADQIRTRTRGVIQPAVVGEGEKKGPSPELAEAIAKALAELSRALEKAKQDESEQTTKALAASLKALHASKEGAQEAPRAVQEAISQVATARQQGAGEELEKLSVELKKVASGQLAVLEAEAQRPQVAEAPRRAYAKGDGITTQKARLETGELPERPALPEGGPGFKVRPGTTGPGPVGHGPVGSGPMGRAGEPNFVPSANDTGAELIPEELRPLTEENREQFKLAFSEAYEKGEKWAKDLQLLATRQRFRLQQEAMKADIPGWKKMKAEERKAAIEKEIDKRVGAAMEQNAPWAAARLVLDSIAAQKKAEADGIKQAAEIEKITNTSFEATAPERYSGDDKKALEKFERDPTKPFPSSADGSMKVPAKNGKFVNEYIRTNPIVEQLQMGDAAHIYNPVYAMHLKATIEAAAVHNGPPPEGKGFLAMTEHGFAYCWNPDYSLEENKQAAEFTLKTGMPFEKCDGLKLPQTLEQFNNWDPTVKGELKLVLDKHGKGKDKVSLKSDGNGTITSSFYTRVNRTERFKDNVEKYGLEVAALVAGVFTGGATVVILQAAVAAKNAYKAVKAGDWFGAILSVAGAFAGAAKLPGVNPTFARVATTIGNVGKVVQGIQGTINAYKGGSIAGVIGGLGTAASGIAGVAGGIKGPNAAQVAKDFDNLAALAEKVGPAVALGEAAYGLYKKGDYVGAFIEGLRFAATAFPDKFPVPAGMSRADFLKKFDTAARALKEVNTQIQNGDYDGALGALLEGVQGVTQEYDADGKPIKSRGQHLLSAGIALTGAIDNLQEGNPGGAAALAGKFINELKNAITFNQDKLKELPEGSAERQETESLLDKLKSQLKTFTQNKELNEGVKGLIEAVKSKDPGKILQEATGFLGQVTGREGFTVASTLISAVRTSIDAVKRGDFVSLMAAQAELERAVGDVREWLDKRNAKDEPLPTTPAVAQGDDPNDPYGLLEPGTAPKPAEGPPPTDGTPVTPGTGEAPPAEVLAYRTRTGDTLSAIARDQLGDLSKWPELYEYNRDALGPNPNSLRVGVLLKMPPEGFTITEERRKEILGIKPRSGNQTPPTSGTGGKPPPKGAAEYELNKRLTEATTSAKEAKQAISETLDELLRARADGRLSPAQFDALEAKLKNAERALTRARVAIESKKPDTASDEINEVLRLVGDAAGGIPKEKAPGGVRDVNQAQGALRDSRQAVKDARAELETLKQQGKVTPAQYDAGKSKLNQAEAALDKAETAIKALDVETANTELQKATGLIAGAIPSAPSTGSPKLDAARRDLAAMKTRLDQVGSELNLDKALNDRKITRSQYDQAKSALADAKTLLDRAQIALDAGNVDQANKHLGSVADAIAVAFSAVEGKPAENLDLKLLKDFAKVVKDTSLPGMSDVAGRIEGAIKAYEAYEKTKDPSLFAEYERALTILKGFNKGAGLPKVAKDFLKELGTAFGQLGPEGFTSPRAKALAKGLDDFAAVFKGVTTALGLPADLADIARNLKTVVNGKSGGNTLEDWQARGAALRSLTGDLEDYAETFGDLKTWAAAVKPVIEKRIDTEALKTLGPKITALFKKAGDKVGPALERRFGPLIKQIAQKEGVAKALQAMKALEPYMDDVVKFLSSNKGGVTKGAAETFLRTLGPKIAGALTPFGIALAVTDAAAWAIEAATELQIDWQNFQKGFFKTFIEQQVLGTTPKTIRGKIDGYPTGTEFGADAFFGEFNANPPRWLAQCPSDEVRAAYQRFVTEQTKGLFPTLRPGATAQERYEAWSMMPDLIKIDLADRLKDIAKRFILDFVGRQQGGAGVGETWW